MTYADNYNLRSPTLYSANNVASAVDGLLASTNQTTANSSVSTSSGSYVDTGTSLAITGASGETLIAIASITLSQSSAAANGAVRLVNNGSQIGQIAAVYFPTTGVGGDNVTVTLVGIVAATVGTNTVKIQYAAGAGTIYSFYRSIQLLLVQTS